MKRTAISGLIGLVLGLVVGIFAEHWRNRQQMISQIALTAGGTIARDTATLHAITNGHPEEAEQLLKGHIQVQGLMLMRCMEELSPRYRDPHLVELADKYRDHLAKAPFEDSQ